VEANTVNAFKYRLDKHWSHQDVSTICHVTTDYHYVNRQEMVDEGV